MLTLETLAALATGTDTTALVVALAEYVGTLEDNDAGNFFMLAEMPAARLVEMAEQAPSDVSRLFTLAALEAGKLLPAVKAVVSGNAIEQLGAKLGELNELTAEGAALVAESATQQPTTVKNVRTAEAYTDLYALPVFSLVGDAKVYEAAAQMQRGRILKHSITGGWFVPGSRPAENVYLDDDAVARMRERNLIVPAVGQNYDEPKEYNLSAIAWRCMGCLFTDNAAKIELAAYSVLGTDKDNPHARRNRAITADWRTRQGRRDIAPTWGKFCEFSVTLGDKVTSGHGAKAVTVVYDFGPQVSTLEFYGPVNESGYATHTVHTGHYGNRSLSQYAYDIAADLVAGFMADADARERAERVRLKHAKPALVIIEPNDDADALAAELGIL